MTRTTHMCTLTQAYTTALSILGIPGNLLYTFLGCKQDRASEKHLQALGGVTCELHSETTVALRS